MNSKLINRANELRSHGFTTGEIADELNVSMDTARWLTLQKNDEKEEYDEKEAHEPASCIMYSSQSAAGDKHYGRRGKL